MAIAFDAKTGMVTGSGTTISTTHTATGSNRIVFVGITIRSTRTITVAPTYAGVAMTQSGSTSGTTGVTNYLYYLIAPSTTAGATVTATQNASDNWAMTVISYANVRQTGQPDATSVGGPTTTTSYSQSVTTVRDNCWAVLYGNATSGSTLTAGSNTIIRNQPEVAFTGAFIIDTNSAKTPAGTDTLNVTSSSQTFAGCMASFSPDTANDYSLSIDQGSYSYTGQLVALIRGAAYVLSIAQGSFSLTGQVLSFILDLYTRVTNRVKNTTTVTNRNKTVSASVTNKVKNATTVTNRTKS